MKILFIFFSLTILSCSKTVSLGEKKANATIDGCLDSAKLIYEKLLEQNSGFKDEVVLTRKDYYMDSTTQPEKETSKIYIVEFKIPSGKGMAVLKEKNPVQGTRHCEIDYYQGGDFL